MKQRYHLVAAALLLAVSACSSAPVPVKDVHFGDWQVMTYAPRKHALLCYTQAAPVSSEGTVEGRGQSYLMATRRESGKIEISTTPGYALPNPHAVTLVIDGKDTHLSGKGNIAWAKSDAEDKRVIQALKTARTVEVRSITPDNGETVDSYSADGFGLAIERIKHLCP